jgi:hypothetical protein
VTSFGTAGQKFSETSETGRCSLFQQMADVTSPDADENTWYTIKMCSLAQDLARHRPKAVLADELGARH